MLSVEVLRGAVAHDPFAASADARERSSHVIFLSSVPRCQASSRGSMFAADVAQRRRGLRSRPRAGPIVCKDVGALPEIVLEPIEGFRSPGEFDRFAAWLAGLVERRDLETVAVRSRYAGLHGPTERWYRRPSSGEVWRLVEPDVPFLGVFERIDDEELGSG